MNYTSLFQLSDITKRIFHIKGELIWVVLGQMLGFLGGVAGVKILTNLMAVESYGQLGLGMTIVGMLNFFVYGPIAQTILRYFSVCRERGHLNIYFYIFKNVHLKVATVLLLGFFVFSIFVGILSNLEWALLVLFAALFGVIGGLNSSFIYFQNANRQRKIVAWHQGMDSWLRVAFALILIYLFSDSGYIALLGFSIATLAITLSQFFFAAQSDSVRAFWQKKPPEKEIERKIYEEFFSFGSAFTMIAFFTTLSLYSDRWLLQGFFGAKEVGIYVAIYQVASAPILLAFGLIGQLMVPIIYDRAGAMTQTTQVEGSNRMLYQTSWL